MSTQFSWHTFYKLLESDPERVGVAASSVGQFSGGGWSR
jgi:hypothetical protein